MVTTQGGVGGGGYSFGDHLRRYRWHLRDQSELREALKRILRHGDCQEETIFYLCLLASWRTRLHVVRFR